MNTNYSIKALVVLALLGLACNADKDATQPSSTTLTETENKEAHKQAKEKADSQMKLTSQLIASLVDKESSLYKNAAEHSKTLNTILKKNPTKFNLFLASLNDFRFSRGLPPIDPKAIAESASLRLAPGVSESIEAPEPEKLGACIASKISPEVDLSTAIKASEPISGFKLAAGDDPKEWDRSFVCPNNCVCAAAEGAASAYASSYAWGYGYGYAQCSDGTTVSAEASAYAYAEAEAHAYAYAFAVACVDDPGGPGACNNNPNPGNDCDGLDEIDPVGGVIKENAGCFTEDGSCAPPEPTVVLPEESAPPTSSDTETSTVTTTTAPSGSVMPTP